MADYFHRFWSSNKFQKMSQRQTCVVSSLNRRKFTNLRWKFPSYVHCGSQIFVGTILILRCTIYRKLTNLRRKIPSYVCCLSRIFVWATLILRLNVPSIVWGKTWTYDILFRRKFEIHMELACCILLYSHHLMTSKFFQHQILFNIFYYSDKQFN